MLNNKGAAVAGNVMRFSEIYEAELGKRNCFKEYKDIVLPAVSNALTTAAVYPIFSSTLASYGLPVAGMAGSVIGSAAIGLAVGGLIYYLSKKNMNFSKMYSEFTEYVFYRDVIYSVGNRLEPDHKAEYKVSVSKVRDFVNSKMHELGTNLISIIEKAQAETDGADLDIAEKIRSAYAKPKQLPNSIMEQVVEISESALVLTVKAVETANKYLRLTGTARTKAIIKVIEKTPDVGRKLIQYRKLQEYVAWDFVEGRIDPQEFYRQALSIQQSMSEVKKQEKLLQF